VTVHARLLICVCLVAPWACNRAGKALPDGATLGAFSDVDKPESYTGPTLYTYMNGGAEFYIKQGFATLSVRRYGRGGERFVLELFEMKDAAAAASVYAAGRRPKAEKELTNGCVATVMPTEVQVAKGRYYLVGRNEDPLASQGEALLNLTGRALATLPGECTPARKEP
jgi:hypothetical protein